MGVLFSIEQDAGIIRAHSGFSSSVYASITLASGFTYGVAVSGTTLIHCSDSLTYRHVAGWTASIASTFANAHAAQRDIYFDGTNLQAGLINGAVAHMVKYSGITATVLADVTDLTSDGHMKSANQVAGAGNTFCSTGDITRSFQTYSGFTGTRLSSFNVTQILGNHGGEHDGTNYIAVLTLSDLSTWIYKLSGFTSTVLAGFVAPTVGTRGVAWSASAFDSTFTSARGIGTANVEGFSFFTPFQVSWAPVASGLCVVLTPSGAVGNPIWPASGDPVLCAVLTPSGAVGNPIWPASGDLALCSVLTPSGAVGHIALPAAADLALCAVNVLSAMATTDGCSWFDLAGASWYDPAAGGWLTLASGGWFDAKECP